MFEMVNFLVGLNFVLVNCCIGLINDFFVDYKLLRIIFIFVGNINIEDELFVGIYFEF